MIRLRYGLLLLSITVAVYMAKSQDSNYYSNAYSFNRNGQYGVGITSDGMETLYVSFSNPCEWYDAPIPPTCGGYMRLDIDANIVWVDTIPSGRQAPWHGSFFWKDSLLYLAAYYINEALDSQIIVAAIDSDDELIYSVNLDMGATDEGSFFLGSYRDGFILGAGMGYWTCENCDTSRLVYLDASLQPVWEFSARENAPDPGRFGVDLLALGDGTFIGTDIGCTALALCGGVTRFDSLGNVVWKHLLNRSAYSSSVAVPKVVPLQDGDFVVTWFTTLNDEPSPLNKLSTFYRMTPGGEIVWTKKITTHPSIKVEQIIPAANGDILGIGVRGIIYPEPGDDERLRGADCGYICRLSSTGDLLWERTICDLSLETTGLVNQYFSDITELSNGDLVMTGYAKLPNPGQVPNVTGGVWIVKTDSLGCITPGCGTREIITTAREILPGGQQNAILSLYPNPVQDQLELSFASDYALSAPHQLVIYDLLGRVVGTYPLSHAPTQSINFGRYVAGMYFWQLQQAGQILQVGSLVK